MKKLIALVLAVMSLCLIFAGCQTETPNDTTPPATTAPSNNNSALALKTGDKVVIVCTAHNKALSSDLQKEGSYYLKGVDVTVANGSVTGYTDAEVWTVTVNDDGSYSFAFGGKNLAMGASFSSTPLGEVNDKWEIVTLDSGAYVLKNIVREQYLEWYADKDNWSAYNKNWETSDLFWLSFFVVG